MTKLLALIAILYSSCLTAAELPQDKTTQVEAANAAFDGAKITLSGNVKVTSNSYTILAKQAILQRDVEKRSALEFPWVELKEAVSASFYEKYFLECDQVNLDYIQHTLTFTSIGKPIFFYEATRQIFADHAYVEYVENGGDFEFVKIVLQGNVYMTSLPHQEEAQYAIAHRVECFPKEERVILKAEEGQRVLFCDRGKQLEISAVEVHAEKRKSDQKELIEGMGDVRFTFKEEEFDKLKEKFHW